MALWQRFQWARASYSRVVVSSSIYMQAVTLVKKKVTTIEGSNQPCTNLLFWRKKKNWPRGNDLILASRVYTRGFLHNRKRSHKVGFYWFI